MIKMKQKIKVKHIFLLYLEKIKSKKKKTSEKLDEVIEEVDDETLSKKNKIKKILELAKNENNIKGSLAAKLLSLFRTTISISTDKDKSKEKSKVKTNDEQINVGKDKEVEIIISSNPLLYKDIIKTSVDRLPPMLVAWIKANIDLANPSEENYKALKKTYASINKTLTIQMRSFTTNYIKLLKGGYESDNVEMFLKSIIDCAKLAFPFKIYRKKLITILWDIMWKYYEFTSDVILICFDAIRKIIHWSKYVKDDLTMFAYKKFLNSFAVHSRLGGAGATSAKTRDNLRLLENWFWELLSIDFVSAYQVEFAIIRKLSTMLRSVRNGFNAKSIKKVVNWQYHHNLHLLSVVLYTHTLKSSELELLVYPYVQLWIATLGISQKNTKFFPFTLKVCKMLNTIQSVSENMYIPVSQYILHLFTGKDDYLNKKTKPTKDALPNYDVAIKFSKDWYETTETKDFVFKSWVQELKRHLQNLSGNLSFPEIVVPICHILGKFKRRCLNPPYYHVIKELYAKIRDVTDKIIQHRKTVDLTDYNAWYKSEQKLNFKNAFMKDQGQTESH